jgi:predicted  nucleic acid-binding Zn-ribbon protein
MTISEITSLVSIALSIGVIVVGATWGLGKIKDAVRELIDDHRREVYKQVDALKREAGGQHDMLAQSVTEQFSAQARQFTDTFAALRQKINDVELDVAKTYMRRESFYQIKGEMSAEIKDFRNDLKDRLDRLETKIDSKT